MSFIKACGNHVSWPNYLLVVSVSSITNQDQFESHISTANFSKIIFLKKLNFGYYFAVFEILLSLLTFSVPRATSYSVPCRQRPRCLSTFQHNTDHRQTETQRCWRLPFVIRHGKSQPHPLVGQSKKGFVPVIGT